MAALLLFFSGFRVYLEIVGFDFSRLPMTRRLSRIYGEEPLRRFHRMGLFLAIGHILLSAPQILFS